MSKLEAVAPSMEQISIDEAFLDITGLREAPEHLARGLQSSIRDELGLPSSIGIAANKLVAKIATEVGKRSGPGDAAPFGLTIVPPGEEAPFLAPLPIEMLWGVGPKTAAKLADLGMHTIGDIARWPETRLTEMLGETGRELARRARGQDERMVVGEHEAKSMSQETTFARDVTDDRTLERTLRQQAADVAHSLRESNLAGATIRLKIRWPPFTTWTRQTTLPHRTDDDQEIARVAIDLMRKVRTPGRPVRLIGVGVTGLGSPVRQLELWDTVPEKSRRLVHAIDALRAKYGDKVIRRGEMP